jgi:hypothetical protein
VVAATTSLSDNGTANGGTSGAPADAEVAPTVGFDTKSGANIGPLKNWASRSVPQTQIGGVTKNGDKEISTPATPMPLVRQKSKPSLIALTNQKVPVPAPNLAANLLAKIAAERGEPLPSQHETVEPMTETIVDQSAGQSKSPAKSVVEPPVWEADFSAPPTASAPVQALEGTATEPPSAKPAMPSWQTSLTNFEAKAPNKALEEQSQQPALEAPKVQVAQEIPAPNWQTALADLEAKTKALEEELKPAVPAEPKVQPESELPAPNWQSGLSDLKARDSSEALLEEESLLPETPKAPPPVTSTWQYVLQDLGAEAPVRARELGAKPSGQPPLQLLAGVDSAKKKEPPQEVPPLDLLARLPRQTSPAHPLPHLPKEKAHPVDGLPLAATAQANEMSSVPNPSPNSLANQSPSVPTKLVESQPEVKVLESLGDAIGEAFENAFLPEAAKTSEQVKKENLPQAKEVTSQPETKPSVPVDYKTAIQAERKSLLKTRQDAMAPQRSAQEDIAASISLPPLAALASIAQIHAPQQAQDGSGELEQVSDRSLDADETNGPSFTPSVVPGGLLRHPTGIIPVYSEKSEADATRIPKIDPKETPIPNTVKAALPSGSVTKVMTALEKEEVSKKAAAGPTGPSKVATDADATLKLPTQPAPNKAPVQNPQALPQAARPPAPKVESDKAAPSGFFMDMSSLGQTLDEPGQPIPKAETDLGKAILEATGLAPSPVLPSKPVVMPDPKASQPQAAVQPPQVPSKPAQVPPPPVQAKPVPGEPPVAAAKPPQAPPQPQVTPPKPEQAAVQKQQQPMAPAPGQIAASPKPVIAQPPKAVQPQAQASLQNLLSDEIVGRGGPEAVESAAAESPALRFSEAEKTEEIPAKADRTTEMAKATSPLDRLIEVAKKGKKLGGTRASHDRVASAEGSYFGEKSSDSHTSTGTSSGPPAGASISSGSSTSSPSIRTDVPQQADAAAAQARVSYGDVAEKTFENTALARAADPRLAAQAEVSFPNQASLQAKRNPAIPAQMPLKPLSQQQMASQQVSRQQIPQVSLDSFPIDPAILQRMAQDEARQVSDLVEAKRAANQHRLSDSAKEEDEGFKAFVSQRYQAILERVHGPKKTIEKPRVSRAMATTRTRTTALRTRGPGVNITVSILSVCLTLVAVACWSTVGPLLFNKKTTPAPSMMQTQGKKDYEEIRRVLEKRQQEGVITKREVDDLSAAYVALGQKEIKAKHYADGVALLQKVSPKSPSYPEANRLMKKVRRRR